MENTLKKLSPIVGGPGSFAKCKTSGVNSAGSSVTFSTKLVRLSLTQLPQATILLTANVAFLAIPSVDSSTNGIAPGSSTGKYVRTPAQVTSFMSAIFSLGCLLVGQLLLRYHTIRPHDSAEEVVSPRRSEFWTLVDRFPRTSIYAAIMTPIVVWKS